MLESYLSQLVRKLKPEGAGFIHHSNLGAYSDASGALTVPNPHWRASTMTAELFRRFCSAAGLRCVTQEIISWSQKPVLNDCFSCFTLDEQPRDGDAVVVERPDFFRAEMACIQDLHALYSLRDVREPSTLPIDWRWEAAAIENIILTCQKETLATAALAGETVQLLDAERGTDASLLRCDDEPGTILKATPPAILVQTGTGTLVLRRVRHLGTIHQASALARSLAATRLG